MEASVEAAELMVPPKPDEAPSLEDEAKACSSPFDTFDPMQEFSHRLEDIIRTHGSADSLLDKLRAAEIQMDEMKEEVKDESFVMETDVSLVRQSLSIISSPEEKLEELIRKYCELAALRLRGEQKTNFLQQTVSVLQEERQQLQAERLSSTAARSKLEALCRDLQGHYNLLRVSNSRVRVRNSMVRVRNSSVRVRNSRVRVRNSMVRVRNSSVRVRNSRVRVRNSMVRVRNSRVRVRNSRVRVRNSMLRVRNSMLR
ncbi:beta-taxilin, partial [Austrofundulus limnaeus]|uniref:Beta-taxilin n=1 Tax=Austrofundulus limnaeus TaxID=52670 RepID=A0A2I4D989_AUSLI